MIVVCDSAHEHGPSRSAEEIFFKEEKRKKRKYPRTKFLKMKKKKYVGRVGPREVRMGSESIKIVEIDMRLISESRKNVPREIRTRMRVTEIKAIGGAPRTQKT